MPDRTTDPWSEDIQRAYDTARRVAGLSYGPWQVVEVPVGVVAYESTPGVYKHAKPAYVVTDLSGNAIATVEVREVAELIAQVPDMCDLTLRPDPPLSTAVAAIYKISSPPDMLGVVNPTMAFGHGIDAGYKVGYGAGYAEGLEEVKPDGE